MNDHAIFEDAEMQPQPEPADVRAVRHWLIALTLCMSAVLIMGAIGWYRVYQLAGDDCAARQDARQSVRALVILVTSPQDLDGDGKPDINPDPKNPLVAYLKHSLDPGQALSEIHC
jgi:hypothetical protein